MRKIHAIVTVFALLIGFGASAQLTYGPKLGLNLANQSGDVENNKMLIGFNIGVAGNYAITDMFGVQAEIIYDKKGAKYEWEGMNGETQKAPLSMGYINIPIMGIANFPVGNDMTVFGELGPTVGILTSVKYDGESEFESVVYDPSNPWSPPTTEMVKYKDWYKSTDIGLAVGGGVEVPVSNMACRIDLRYNFSFGTIHAEPEGSSGDNQESIRNGVLSINGILMFGGGS